MKMINKTTLATTFLTTLFAVNTFAGQLIIENGQNKVSITAGANNSLVVNGKTFNSEAPVTNSSLKIHDISGKVIGDFISLSDDPLGGINPILIKSSFSGMIQLPSDDGSHYYNSTVLGKFNLAGTEYTTSITRDLAIPNSIILYNDSSCSVAKYVITKTIAGGAWGKNSIVVDGNKPQAYVVGEPVWDDNIYKTDTVYGYVYGKDYSNNTCTPIDLNKAAFGVSALKQQLPNNIVKSETDTSDDFTVKIYNHYLNIPGIKEGALSVY
ncbi:hypothetical protein [Photobacterium carnosum]|uniref:hypothetical protein n=1 Tax=Photobacterium carnosum TaxID=2023717 RepID=UPI001E614357|nr:hypothetical protein [Photobacterium carnosum]MCD9529583.1 hypothetical protein [Photobacterium carnosum]MCF2153928.1 hypothetical protein [Photobacterium carnosum]MCF2215688.1 hypothetical protein [Photobacterium carnosum]